MNLDLLLRVPGEWLQQTMLTPWAHFWPAQGMALLLLPIVAALLIWRMRAWRVHPAYPLAQRVLVTSTVCVTALLVAGLLWTLQQPRAWLLAAAFAAFLLVPIRLILYAISRQLHPPRPMGRVERIAGWVIWILVVLFLLQRLQPVVDVVDSVSLPLGKTRVSLLDGLRGLFVVAVFVAAASYLGGLFERRFLLVTQLPIGVRLGVAKVTRVMLVLIAGLIALTAVGLDLTALTVIGGAIGVGLGFGLQRIAANFVSGFVLLGDRSIRPGDVITIGTRFGVVLELRARYVVVRDRDGVDTLIPNENLITSEVINWSYGDRQIRLKLPLVISYQDNPRQAMALMVEAAMAHPRVEKEPAPVARVMAFADNGIELELRFWIRDPEDGINNVRSDLFLSIWDAFGAARITIPYPQRVLHTPAGGPPAPAAAREDSHVEPQSKPS
jgi:small-conductance mechanosensitive channel